jgi:hypothetical protein
MMGGGARSTEYLASIRRKFRIIINTDVAAMRATVRWFEHIKWCKEAVAAKVTSGRSRYLKHIVRLFNLENSLRQDLHTVPCNLFNTHTSSRTSPKFFHSSDGPSVGNSALGMQLEGNVV